MFLGKFGHEVEQYKVTKECEWKSQKKNEPYWDCFFSESSNFIENRPKHRLIPRICIV